MAECIAQMTVRSSYGQRRRLRLNIEQNASIAFGHDSEPSARGTS